MTRSNIFGNLNFSTLASNRDFQETSVREFVILPILTKLGYDSESIVCEKRLQDPFLRRGSKKYPVELVPDYVLKIDSSYACVVEAKAPKHDINNHDFIEQAFSYANHPEIRSTYFALCNGWDFLMFRTGGDGNALLHFGLSEFDQHWDTLKRYLSRESFQTGKPIEYEKPTGLTDRLDFPAT